MCIPCIVGVPSPPGSLLHLLLVDSCGWPFWLVWCDICGHFCHSPVIIRNAEHLVFWAFGFLLLFFFSFKGVRKIYQLQLASWKSAVFGIYTCNTHPKTFPEDSCHQQCPRPCELHLQLSRAGQSVVIGKTHRQQQFFLPKSDSSGNEILRENRLPGLWIRVESAWANTQGLLSQCIFLLKLYLSPPDPFQPGAPLPAWIGDPSTQRLGDFSKVLVISGLGHHLWVHWRLCSQPSKPDIQV